MEKFSFRSLSAGFGFFDTGCKSENLLKPGDVEHGQDTWSDSGESELDMLVAAVDFVIDDFAHAGRIHEGDAAEIEDGVRRWLCATKKSTQGQNAVQGNGAREAQNDDSWFAAGNRLDLQGDVGGHVWISVWNGRGFVVRKVLEAHAIG